jgi:sugar phosphate isomerase/epimerase
MANFRYSVNTNSLRGIPPVDVARLAKRAGLDGIEWGLPPAAELSPAVAKEMQNVTAGEGLAVAAFINAGHLWKKDLMRTYSEIVAGAGGRVLRVSHPWLAWNYEESLHQRDSFMDLFRRAQAGLVALVPLSREFGIRYVLEMHSGSLTATAPACRMLMDGLPAAAVGVIYDPANGVHEGFLRPRHSTEALGPYLAYVHAKNLVLEPAADFLPGPVKRLGWNPRTVGLETGVVDFVEVMFALKCVGFDGWISLEETFKPATAETVLNRAVAFLRECDEAAPDRPQAPFTTFND